MRPLAVLAVVVAAYTAFKLNQRGDGLPKLTEAYKAARDHSLWHSIASKHPSVPETRPGEPGPGRPAAHAEHSSPAGTAVQYERVLVFGDLHGDLAQALKALALVGATDEEGRWIAGRSLLVQLGDLVDRGNASLAVMDLVEDLQAQAQAAGGRVITLLGNHELMQITGDFRYVNKEELASLGRQAMAVAAAAKPDPAAAVEDGAAPAAAELLGDAQGGACLQAACRQLPVLRETELLQLQQVQVARRETVAGLMVWRAMMAPAGRYGAAVRSRPLAHLVLDSDLSPGSGRGGQGSPQGSMLLEGSSEEPGRGQGQAPGPCSILFIHAGALNWMLDAVELLAQQAGTAEDLGGATGAADAAQAPEAQAGGSGSDGAREDGPSRVAAAAGLVGDTAGLQLQPRHYIDTWNAAVREGLQGCSGRQCPNRDAAGAPLTAALLGGDGAVWTRAYTEQPAAWVCRQVSRLTRRLGVSRVVVGHTIQEDGLSVRCGGRLLMADVGMSSWIIGNLTGLRCSQERGLEWLLPGREPEGVQMNTA